MCRCSTPVYSIHASKLGREILCSGSTACPRGARAAPVTPGPCGCGTTPAAPAAATSTASSSIVPSGEMPS
eukprot:scaffold18795_cov129-Isochrysis_galbana.AAC.5